jgi:hypothetical protein
MEIGLRRAVLAMRCPDRCCLIRCSQGCLPVGRPGISVAAPRSWACLGKIHWYTRGHCHPPRVVALIVLCFVPGFNPHRLTVRSSGETCLPSGLPPDVPEQMACLFRCFIPRQADQLGVRRRLPDLELSAYDRIRSILASNAIPFHLHRVIRATRASRPSHSARPLRPNSNC